MLLRVEFQVVPAFDVVSPLPSGDVWCGKWSHDVRLLGDLRGWPLRKRDSPEERAVRWKLHCGLLLPRGLDEPDTNNVSTGIVLPHRVSVSAAVPCGLLLQRRAGESFFK